LITVYGIEVLRIKPYKNIVLKKFFVLIFVCCACNYSPKTKMVKDDTVNSNPKSTKTKSEIIDNRTNIAGTWTSGDSENATFEINADSVYYVEHFESYKYSVDKDSIKIYYPDFTYSAKVYFIKDTMVMSSKEDGVSKFWRFKNR
jgi:hypothetical protein